MENNHPQISVIVPVYNAEKYLTQCIDSILRQDFTDFELLLIDDGSKDKSGFICDEYAQTDQRIKVFHKENGGVSSARNLGIDKTQGEFIAFIDSDDYVDSNYLSSLTNINADLVTTGYETFGNDNNSTNRFSYKDNIYSGQTISTCLSSVLNDTPVRSPWGKLYKNNIIKNNKIYFNTSLRIAEDTVFVQTYLLYCHTIAFQSGCPYHYRLISDNSSCFKYSLTSSEYIFTLNTVLESYKKITNHFNFTCIDYFQTINKLMLMLYFRNITKKSFILSGFSDYKRTMKLLCPEVSFSDKLFSIAYWLLKKNLPFLSFFLLRVIYPFKLYFDRL